MATNLTNSTSQVNLASYGTGNPFSVGSGVSIVNSTAGQTAIYGDASQAWTLTNAGTVGGGGNQDATVDGGIGIDLHSTGMLTNTGSIGGGDGSDHSPGINGGLGVNATGALALTNSGMIVGGDGGGVYMGRGGDGAIGVLIGGTGTVTNMAGGMIAGGGGGYGIYGHQGGNGEDGIFIGGSGTVVNRAGATIAGGDGASNGAYVGGHYGGGSGGWGILLAAGGKVTNAGTIKAGSAGYVGDTPSKYLAIGVQFYGSANSTLTNSGTISGGDGVGRAIQFAGGDDRLILQGGSVLKGGVDGGGGSNTLELRGGTSSGEIDDIGTAITHFQKIIVDAGGNWTANGTIKVGAAAKLAVKGTLTLNGTSTIAGPISGAGTLTVGAGTTTIVAGAKISVATLGLTADAAIMANADLTYAGDLSVVAGSTLTVGVAKTLTLSGVTRGAGTVDIGAKATLASKGTVGAAETVAFAANNGELKIVDVAGFKAGVSGFGAGREIDIDNSAFKFGKGETLSFVENAAKTGGTLALKNGANRLVLHLFGQYVAQGFNHSGDGHGGTLITYQPAVVDATNHLATGGHG